MARTGVVRTTLVRATVAGATLLASLSAGAGPDACGPSVPCTPEAFVTRLLLVADETQPAAVSDDFARAFGVELARHTSVLVSALLPANSANDVVRFVRLGDAWYPLNFGVAGECLTFGPLDRLLTADGWQGGRAAGGSGEVWVYRKGRTQLSAQPVELADAAGKARSCAGSIVLTYR